MCEDMIKKIYDISERYGSKKVAIITNHLKITGTLCECEEKKKDDGILTLSDARMWRIQDICTCGEESCKCNEENFCALDWLNINLYKVVAFSLIKE